jgi:hypothetical protein
MTNTVILKRSSVANSVPGPGNLVAGELAINYTDGNLFYKNNNNVITVIASNKFLSVIGNITGNNAAFGGLVSATGNVTGGNFLTSGLISATAVTSSANITGGNILTAGVVSATGNITGNYFIGNGSQLTGLIASTANSALSLINGTTNLTTATNGNANLTIGGTSNVVVWDTTGQYVTGLISATGNITGSSLLGSVVSASANITGGNIRTAGLISATSTITSAANISGNYFIGNGSQLSDVAATSIQATVTAAQGNTNLVFANIADNDYFRIMVGGTNDSGFVEIATADNSNEPIYVRQYNFVGSNNFGSIARTLTLLDANGNTLVPQVMSAAGNVIGGNILTAGLVSASGTITGTSHIGSVVSVTANITGGNIITGGSVLASGLISATSTITSAANITGGNVLTGGLISATSTITSAANITGGNILTGGLISATGTVAASSVLGSVVSVTANITGGNVLTGGLVSSSGTITSTANITGGNILTGGLISSTGNITSGNILTGGLISATSSITSSANITGSNLLTGGLVSSAGNVTGSNVFASGLISAGSTITSAANITGGNVLTGGLISATSTITSAANIAGGNLLTVGLVSATGNISANYFIGNGSLLTGISAGGSYSNANVAAYLPTYSGNLASLTGPVTTTGDVTGAYIYGNGYYLTGISGGTNIAPLAGTVDNFTGNGVQTNFTLSTTPTSVNLIFVNVNGVYQLPTAYSLSTNVLTMTSAVPNGAVLSVTQLSGGGIANSLVNGSSNIVVAANGNISMSAAGTANVAVVASGGLYMTGNVIPSANITYDLGTSTQRWKDLWLSNSTIYLGNAQISANATSVTITNPAGGTTVLAGTSGNSELTGAVVSATGNITGGNLIQGTTRVYKWTTQANTAPSNPVPGDEWYNSNNDVVYKYINDGTSNAWVDQSFPTSFSTLAVTGNAAITGNLTVSNISISGTFSAESFSANANITAGNLSVSTGSITTGNIINANGNGVGNIGSSTTYFNTVFAKATSAQYADLAEHYAADAYYEPGTVVVFGGTAEITISNISHDTRVAGVVSTKPAFTMNEQNPGVVIALTGRVPCKVRGPVSKGDRLVNIEPGIAGRLDPALADFGCIIGKALEDVVNEELANIEISVGRT